MAAFTVVPADMVQQGLIAVKGAGGWLGVQRFAALLVGAGS